MPLRNHSPSTSEEFDDQTGKLSDYNDLTMDCDTNEDPQYDIFMEAQARLEAEGLGDFLPKLRSLSAKAQFIDMVNFLSVDDARTFRYQRQTLVWWCMLLKQHDELILITCDGLKFLGIMDTLSRDLFHGPQF